MGYIARMSRSLRRPYQKYFMKITRTLVREPNWNRLCCWHNYPYQAIRNYHRIYPTALFPSRAKFKILAAAIVSSGLISFAYEIQMLKRQLTSLVPEFASKIGEESPASYVYSPFPLMEASPWYMRRFPWISLCDEAPVWHYIAQTKSDDPVLREEAIKKLVSLKGLTEAEYGTIASAIDFKTAVILAHAGAHPSMVTRPHLLHPEKKNMCLATKFRDILTALPPNSIHEAILGASFTALKTFNPTHAEKMDSHMELASGFLSEFEPLRPIRTLAEESVLKPCLQALLSHSRIKEQVPSILEHGAMDLLLVISRKYKTDHDIMGLVIKVLSSLTCCETSNAAFEESGILGVIAECAASDDVRLSFPARKALRNLDRENYKYILPPGVYQVYPDRRANEEDRELDIVFVHGLMGGAFRTWRSQDPNAVWRLKRKTESSAEGLCPTSHNDTGSLAKRAEFLRHKILDADHNAAQDTVIPVTDQASFRDRLEHKLKSIPKKLLSPPEKDIQPRNRELRNGEMYFYPPDEEIPVELHVLPASPITKCWPRDWLPLDFPNIRVICADFETFITHWNPVMPIENLGRTIQERSDELIEKLAQAGIGDRPIVWVCHSAGGVIVKNMLGTVDGSEREDLKRIARMTKGAVFCSTPHFGSRIIGVGKSGKILLPTVEIVELMKDSAALKKIDTTFQSLMDKYSYKVISFGELCPTLGSVGISRKLVPVDSSDPGYGDYYGLRLDHLNICKPRSRHSFVYVKIRDLINRILLDNGNDSSA